MKKREREREHSVEQHVPLKINPIKSKYLKNLIVYYPVFFCFCILDAVLSTVLFWNVVGSIYF